MKTYYELLSIDPAAAPHDIKQAFRREIARYHPDKVQHLGPEFQEIAATRAAELTEAYRVLMDASARARYDETLKGTRPAPSATPKAGPPPAADSETAPRPADAEPPRPAHAAPQEKPVVNEFVRRAIVARFREGMAAVGGNAMAVPASGFDIAYNVKPKGSLFKKAEPSLRLLSRVVPHVDGPAVEDAWPLALKAAARESACVLLLGASGMAPPKELAAAVAEQRRKSRGAGPMIVPIDVRDWEALFPPEAPALVRSLLQWLREGRT